MSSEHEHAIITRIGALRTAIEALPAGPEATAARAALEALRRALGDVGYHGV